MSILSKSPVWRLCQHPPGIMLNPTAAAQANALKSAENGRRAAQLSADKQDLLTKALIRHRDAVRAERQQ